MKDMQGNLNERLRCSIVIERPNENKISYSAELLAA